MSNALRLIHDGALAAGVGTALYTATVTIASLTALFAPTAQQRRDARTVLTILLRNRHPRVTSDSNRTAEPTRSTESAT